MALMLVTGAAGFVGSAVTRRLLMEGHRVRTVARAGAPGRNLAGTHIEVVIGDLRDEALVQCAMAGVEGVFHVAADYRLWAPDPDEIRRNNLTMTENVMRAAAAEGAARIVYTSSVATLRPPVDAAPSDENDAMEEAEAVGAYKRSKVAAERLVERMIEETDLPAVIVNPSTPIGPGDAKPTPTGRVVVEAASGRMPAYVDTGLNLVHVDDVAAGHLAAYERGRIGERYILGGQDVSLGRMLADIAELVGRRPPRLRLRQDILMPLAFAMEALSRLTRREPFLSVDALKMSRHKMYYASAKAERELGYGARPYREALADAIAWFRAEGMLR
jgi:dihydroflavonol-4-reductase